MVRRATQIDSGWGVFPVFLLSCLAWPEEGHSQVEDLPLAWLATRTSVHGHELFGHHASPDTHVCGGDTGDRVPISGQLAQTVC